MEPTQGISNEQLIAALQPFAQIGAWLFARNLPDETPVVEINGLHGAAGCLTRGDFKAAFTVMQAIENMRGSTGTNHKLDTDRQVFFYEQDFYVLSNFSAFRLLWKGYWYDTSEAAYHSEKFPHDIGLQIKIRQANSAHESFKIAEANKEHRRSDWDSVKVGIMRDILRAKAQQHEYVRRKLLATGDRELIEDSWRDDYWGWGPNRDGENMLGRLWMEVRAELRGVSLHTQADRPQEVTSGGEDDR